MKYLLGVLTLSLIVSCTNGKRDNINKSGDFDTICVDNHVYYEYESPYKYALSVKLNDDGKPIKCK